MLFLGDDSLFLFNSSVDITGLYNEIADNFNMQSKVHIRKNYGTFC